LGHAELADRRSREIVLHRRPIVQVGPRTHRDRGFPR
jgi:hypothetical protein